MLWKPDAEQAIQRLAAWWQQELIDRPCIQITAPRAEQWWQVEHIPVPPMPATWEEYWTDLDYRIAAQAEGMRRTYFGGEALPVFSNRGRIFAASLAPSPPSTAPRRPGSPYHRGLSSPQHLRLNNRWLKLQLEYMRRPKASEGRWLIGMPDTL